MMKQQSQTETVFFSHAGCVVGEIYCACLRDRIIRIRLPNETEPVFFSWINEGFPDHPLAEAAAPVILKFFRQLSEYLEGRRQEFDVPLDLRGSAFQRQVWKELLKIPYGQVISYGEMARRIGRPGACRAVGSANGSNPLPIVVPCHRVIGSNGKLTGYGGGVAMKSFLLQLEGRQKELFFSKTSSMPGDLIPES
jgi:O-6-methylguanine DNA methyltransferase